MPFIRGRYHINPVAGEALETAREAEAALLALEQDLRDGDFAGSSTGLGASTAKGPIRHVEIDAAELVPSHSGHAVRGFVARVHRSSPLAPAVSSEAKDDENLSSGSSADSASPSRPSCPETHAFTDHRDLVNFLRGEFAKDAAR